MEENLANLYRHREQVAWAKKPKQLPVTLVTGFLGAGKTSLITHILGNKHNLKIAAAVNDFAEVNVDGQIVRGTTNHDDVVELSNGCLCCSISGEFKTAVWKLLQDCDIGKIDYLLVETSGVTDPHQTISTLEEEYGKMYRVRLDTVVTVVDTDALVTKLEANTNSSLEEDLGSVAAKRQLKCADVILLNKRDLVSEDQLKKAEKFVSELVPGVQVHSCNQGAVPLHWIMEVEETSSGSQLVSHEVTASAYTVSLQGGGKNKQRRQRAKEDNSGDQQDHGKNHLSVDEFVSVVFESSKPLCLGKFQAFLGKGFPTGLQRMKGTVWFQENPSCLYSFHMSGRQRYELAPIASQSNPFAGSFKVQVIGIGNIDVDAVHAQLEGCVSSSVVCSGPDLLSLYQTAVGIVTGDDWFKVVEGGSEDECARHQYVDFRLTGCIEYGISEEEAAGFHGINFNEMNFELARRVNGSCNRVSLMPVMCPSGLVVCRHSVLEDSSFEESWELVKQVSTSLINKYYRAVGFCKCGR